MKDSYSKKPFLKEELKQKKENDKGIVVGHIDGTKILLSEDKQYELAKECMRELDKTETALEEIISGYPDVKKAYLDNDKKSDPFYVDYNLLFNNIDMMMAIMYSNEMKVVFRGTCEADMGNADIITKTAEHDYKREMGMGLKEYELGIDKLLAGVGCTIWDNWNKKTKSPVPIVAPAEFFRPDPMGWGCAENYRWLGFFGYMTKAQMRQSGFDNVDDIRDTEWKNDKTGYKGNNGTGITIEPDKNEDPNANYVVYNHFRRNKDGRICLVTLTNCGKLVNRYVELDYMIGDEYVYPISLDFRRPMRGYPMGIRLYDLGSRKQKVLSLLLNLAVKKSVRSSLGNHLIVDEKAVKNKQQLKQLSEFPEIILVDTEGGKKSVNNLVTELQRSQVPQDNYDVANVIKQLNYEETSIGPNQLGISSTGDQTATEIKDMAANSNIRLSLSNRISINFYIDFRRKWLMFYNYHYDETEEKQVVISREYGDKYLTFKKKYLYFSQDPHIDIRSKFDIEQQSKKIFSNHVVIHSYIQQLAAQGRIPLSVRLSLRKALRLLGYSEDEILDYVEESFEELEAKQQLLLLNRGVELAKLSSSQVDERHEDYLHVYKQAKENKATRKAVMERIQLLRARKKKEQKMMLSQQSQGGTNQLTNGITNQMTGQMIQQSGDKSTGLEGIQY